MPGVGAKHPRRYVAAVEETFRCGCFALTVTVCIHRQENRKTLHSSQVTQVSRMVSIFLPPGRVEDDVFPDAVQLAFVADNAVVVVSLPDVISWRTAYLVDLAC